LHSGWRFGYLDGDGTRPHGPFGRRSRLILARYLPEPFIAITPRSRWTRSCGSALGGGAIAAVVADSHFRRFAGEITGRCIPRGRNLRIASSNWRAHYAILGCKICRGSTGSFREDQTKEILRHCWARSFAVLFNRKEILILVRGLPPDRCCCSRKAPGGRAVNGQCRGAASLKNCCRRLSIAAGARCWKKFL